MSVSDVRPGSLRIFIRRDPADRSGEQISGHFVKNVRRYLEQGFEVQGLSDQTSETVCVVRNEM